jgi:hypothetical protein
LRFLIRTDKAALLESTYRQDEGVRDIMVLIYLNLISTILKKFFQALLMRE